jgi:hypothetical protein
MHGVANDAIGVDSSELADNGSGLLQDFACVLNVIPCQFVGMDAYRLSHIRRHQSEILIADEHGITHRVFENLRDIDEDFLTLFDAEVFDILCGLSMGHSLLEDMATVGPTSSSIGRKITSKTGNPFVTSN